MSTHSIPIDAGPCQEPRPFSQLLAFEVAGLRVEMASAGDGPVLTIPRVLEPFRASGVNTGAGINLTVHWADELPFPHGRPVFQSGGVWSLYRRGTAHDFFFQSPATGASPYKAAVLDAGFQRGRVWLSRKVFGELPSVYPLEYPLDELLVIHRLARGEGVEVHACGVRDECGRGFLFVGHSGAGKSTLARLWLQRPGVHILSDDRIILRRDPRAGGGLRLHGTPWHGEARLALPMSAPLAGVFFLEHAAQNEIEAIPPGRAAAELAARSFLPFHSAEALEFALNFFAALVAEVPCHTFKFLPAESAVYAVERYGGAN